jgi:hypothetical protein
MTVREIYRNQWKGLTTPDAVWTAINVLEPLGQVRVESEGRGGQRSDAIRINPRLVP